jgi:hypothetical protein
LPQILGQGGGALEFGARLLESTELLEQVSTRAGQQMVASERRLVGQRI